MNNFVWIVGGGPMQVPAIQEAQRRDYKIIVSDGDPGCVASVHADLMLSINTYDVGGHRKIAKELRKDHNICAVLCPGVDVGPTVSAVAEILGLPAVPYRVATNTRNKGLMRMLTNQAHPRYLIVHGRTLSNRLKWGNTIDNPYPCIVKPVDNCATRGITVVQSGDELDAAIAFAMANNKETSAVIVEEMLSGPESAHDFMIDRETHDAIWVNGAERLFRTHIPGYSNKLFGIEGAAINPFEPPDEVKELATTLARRLEVTEGPFKLDMIEDPRYGWIALEAATRLSGGWDHMFMGSWVGKDITGLLLDYSLGLPFDWSKLTWNGRYAADYIPYHDAGRISGWSYGLTEEQEKKFEVKNIFTRATTVIDTLSNCAARPLFVMTTGETRQRALLNAMHAAKFIQPIRVG